jgi:nucleotide-binding universal stress UspA family protein
LYERILVPVDGSENAKAALKEAIKIAKLTGGKITVMHTYQSWSPALIDNKQAWHAALKNAAKTILDNAQKIAAAEGYKVETLLVDGNAVQEIVNTANSGHFDLIVMGARGISKITEILLGSISSGVIKKAKCPVLIIKEKN